MSDSTRMINPRMKRRGSSSTPSRDRRNPNSRNRGNTGGFFSSPLFWGIVGGIVILTVILVVVLSMGGKPSGTNNGGEGNNYEAFEELADDLNNISYDEFETDILLPMETEVEADTTDYYIYSTPTPAPRVDNRPTPPRPRPLPDDHDDNHLRNNPADTYDHHTLESNS